MSLTVEFLSFVFIIAGKVLDGDHRNAEMKKMLAIFFEHYRPLFFRRLQHSLTFPGCQMKAWQAGVSRADCWVQEQSQHTAGSKKDADAFLSHQDGS